MKHVRRYSARFPTEMFEQVKSRCDELGVSFNSALLHSLNVWLNSPNIAAAVADMKAQQMRIHLAHLADRLADQEAAEADSPTGRSPKDTEPLVLTEGQLIAFSGEPNAMAFDDIRKDMRALGLRVAKVVNRKVTALVCGPHPTYQDIDAAESYGVRVVLADDFRAIIEQHKGNL